MLVDERYDFQFVTLQQLCMKCLRLEEVGQKKSTFVALIYYQKCRSELPYQNTWDNNHAIFENCLLSRKFNKSTRSIISMVTEVVIQNLMIVILAGRERYFTIRRMQLPSSHLFCQTIFNLLLNPPIIPLIARSSLLNLVLQFITEIINFENIGSHKMIICHGSTECYEFDAFNGMIMPKAGSMQGS